MKLLKCLSAVLCICFTLNMIAADAFAQTVLITQDFDQKLSATPEGQLVDVRTPGEYAQGHLTNSQNMDVRDPVFVQKLATLDKDKPVFVY